MTGLTRHWRRACAVCRRFGKAEDGIAALEFAMLAAPFFFMLFAVLEVALVFVAATTLENATAEAARNIRTGQFQSGGGGAAEFADLVCDGAEFLLDCDRLNVDVRTFNAFGGMDPGSPINEDGELEGDFQFNPGNGGDIVLVRVFYDWPVITPMIGQGLSNMSGNRRLMTAAAAFRNEPF